MSVSKRSFQLLGMLMLASVSVTAQQYRSDVQLWTGIKLKKDLPKRFSVGCQYQVRIDHFVTAFKGSYLYANVQYEIIKKHLEGEFEYRYVTSPKQDKHRFGFALTGKYKVWKVTFSNRLAYQREQEYFNAAYQEGHEPTNCLRNRFEVQYHFKKHWDAYLSTEPLIRLSNTFNGPDRLRSVAGVDWEFAKGHSVEMFYVFQLTIHRQAPARIHSFGLLYTWDVPDFKKKKRK